MLNYEYLRVHIDSTKFRGQEYVGLAWMRSLAGEQMGLKGGLKFSGSSWEDLGRFCQVHWKITTSSGNLWPVQRVKLKFMWSSRKDPVKFGAAAQPRTLKMLGSSRQVQASSASSTKVQASRVGTCLASTWNFSKQVWRTTQLEPSTVTEVESSREVQTSSSKLLGSSDKFTHSQMNKYVQDQAWTLKFPWKFRTRSRKLIWSSVRLLGAIYKHQRLDCEEKPPKRGMKKPQVKSGELATYLQAIYKLGVKFSKLVELGVTRGCP